MSKADVVLARLLATETVLEADAEQRRMAAVLRQAITQAMDRELDEEDFALRKQEALARARASWARSADLKTGEELDSPRSRLLTLLTWFQSSVRIPSLRMVGTLAMVVGLGIFLVPQVTTIDDPDPMRGLRDTVLNIDVAEPSEVSLKALEVFSSEGVVAVRRQAAGGAWTIEVRSGDTVKLGTALERLGLTSMAAPPLLIVYRPARR